MLVTMESNIIGPCCYLLLSYSVRYIKYSRKVTLVGGYTTVLRYPWSWDSDANRLHFVVLPARGDSLTVA